MKGFTRHNSTIKIFHFSCFAVFSTPLEHIFSFSQPYFFRKIFSIQFVIFTRFNIKSNTTVLPPFFLNFISFFPHLATLTEYHTNFFAFFSLWRRFFKPTLHFADPNKAEKHIYSLCFIFSGCCIPSNPTTWKCVWKIFPLFYPMCDVWFSSAIDRKVSNFKLNLGTWIWWPDFSRLII